MSKITNVKPKLVIKDSQREYAFYGGIFEIAILKGDAYVNASLSTDSIIKAIELLMEDTSTIEVKS